MKSHHITTHEILILLKYFKEYYPEQYQQFNFDWQDFLSTGELKLSTIRGIYIIDISPKDVDYYKNKKKLPLNEKYLHLSISDSNNNLYDDLTLSMSIEFFQYNFSMSKYYTENYGQNIHLGVKPENKLACRKFQKELLSNLKKDTNNIISRLKYCSSEDFTN